VRSDAQEHLEQVKDKNRDQRIEVALSVLKALGGDDIVQKSEDKNSSVETAVRFLRPRLATQKLA
jgi:hypothetical protein